MNVNEKADTAKQLFLSGANCAQAVLGAFEEECNLDHDAAMRLASGFGGGFARMREVCGTVSGMFLVLNILYGYSDLDDKSLKDAHYERLRRVADAFKAETGSIVCRVLLGFAPNENNDPVSTPRTENFYKKRPCAELCALAASIVAKELASWNGTERGNR